MFDRQSDHIDRLLIDVSLPDRNGCELARSALTARPGVQVLLMSELAGAEVCKF